MSKATKWYYKISWLVRLIIAILPPTSWIVHAIVRISSGKLFSVIVGILSLLIVALPIIYVVDLITTIVFRRLLLT